ncbi:hypothetical protein CO033_02150 [Candidatus Nomurabacteria bacterium CG_4_9_14_0_2_um_filter_32_10]|uniref:Uncharacterized protein n=3 Tax=Candidatus Nomuraibacteriota TaxID=1752729 RepID=A0A2H0CH82_9BACT|nr:MAG: hypothetical protein COW91_01045 [Candidatus Nomurabacteria bacterium CG22_combo_CG10-13_8_21_14_all_32_8]PIZ85815.1 MAG: hypothetical protein COX94_01945 [Candidatus Nomurabacteria bacterium CG_4_10_14_0_2_um_filter_33_9]PJC49313.1 MAG: hypothetical protein CO033_02150 [Candidatus Nomurabacteria bacterium CG_4_9_14_0_2_um_filter_32_10]
MKKKLIGLSSLVLGFAPFVALAAQPSGGRCDGIGLGSVEGIICKIGDILSVIIPILIVLGVVYFVWGVITYVISDDEEAKKKGKNRMIYGIIGLVVIVAMWGLVGIVDRTFGLGTGTTAPPLPEVPF